MIFYMLKRFPRIVHIKHPRIRLCTHPLKIVINVDKGSVIGMGVNLHNKFCQCSPNCSLLSSTAGWHDQMGMTLCSLARPGTTHALLVRRAGTTNYPLYYPYYDARYCASPLDCANALWHCRLSFTKCMRLRTGPIAQLVCIDEK
jgi:hypothetical protein